MKGSKIAWTDNTFNPWIGCTKKSPGCANCYAESGYGRRFRIEWGPGKPRRRTSEDYWDDPRKWDRDAARTGHSPLVFCGSLCDWLDPEVPIRWLVDLLNLIGETPRLTWLLLTKRPGLWRGRMEQAAAAGSQLARRWLAGDPPRNVWMGVTVEDQIRVDENIPQLLAIPARVRFLSCEPQLERIEMDLRGINWAICAGESGHHPRPFDIAWARHLLAGCREARVPFFMKQLGCRPMENGRPLSINSKKGEDPAEWPEDIRVREFPERPTGEDMPKAA